MCSSHKNSLQLFFPTLFTCFPDSRNFVEPDCGCCHSGGCFLSHQSGLGACCSFPPSVTSPFNSGVTTVVCSFTPSAAESERKSQKLQQVKEAVHLFVDLRSAIRFSVNKDNFFCPFPHKQHNQAFFFCGALTILSYRRM